MNFQPPTNFKPAGTLVRAEFSSVPPPFIKKNRYSGRRADGVRYEKKVQEYLLDLYQGMYSPNPWFHFLCEDENNWRWCQPDGLLMDFSTGKLVIVEVKYSHTSDAWWQVRRLYQPVVKKAFVDIDWDISVCEIVKWYDPAVKFPEHVELSNDITRVTDKFKVHIWRP